MKWIFSSSTPLTFKRKNFLESQLQGNNIAGYGNERKVNDTVRRFLRKKYSPILEKSVSSADTT